MNYDTVRSLIDSGLEHAENYSLRIARAGGLALAGAAIAEEVMRVKPEKALCQAMLFLRDVSGAMDDARTAYRYSRSMGSGLRTIFRDRPSSDLGAIIVEARTLCVFARDLGDCATRSECRVSVGSGLSAENDLAKTWNLPEVHAWLLEGGQLSCRAVAGASSVAEMMRACRQQYGIEAAEPIAYSLTDPPTFGTIQPDVA